MKKKKQYHIYEEGISNFKWIKDPSTGLRIGVGQLNKKYTEISELTLLGINGIEDFDWEYLKRNSTIVTGQLVREGVRDGAHVFDIELTEKGFNGVENTDWINIQSNF